MYSGLRGECTDELFSLKHGLGEVGMPSHLFSSTFLFLFLARASPCSEDHSNQNDYGVNTNNPRPPEPAAEEQVAGEASGPIVISHGVSTEHRPRPKGHTAVFVLLLMLPPTVVLWRQLDRSHNR